MIKPLWDNVLAKRLEPDEKTHGGIIIPENARQKMRHAKVVAVGTGNRSTTTGELVPLTVKPGDLVLVGSNFEGTDISFAGEKYEMIKENYVFGIIGTR